MRPTKRPGEVPLDPPISSFALVPSHGGEGGGLPSQNQKDLSTSQNFDLLQNQTGEEASLADVLRDCGVLVLNRAQRQKLASTIEIEGFKIADVLALREYLFVNCDDKEKAQRILAAKLINPDGRKEMFVDMRLHAERGFKAARPVVPGRGIIEENMQRVRSFDAEYERWVEAKKAGVLPPVERRRMPWERNVS